MNQKISHAQPFSTGMKIAKNFGQICPKLRESQMKWKNNGKCFIIVIFTKNEPEMF